MLQVAEMQHFDKIAVFRIFARENIFLAFMALYSVKIELNSWNLFYKIVSSPLSLQGRRRGVEVGFSCSDFLDSEKNSLSLHTKHKHSPHAIK